MLVGGGGAAGCFHWFMLCGGEDLASCKPLCWHVFLRVVLGARDSDGRCAFYVSASCARGVSSP